MGVFIKPNHEYLVYRGRYDNTNVMAPVFGFPYSGIAVTFEGTELSIRLQNRHYESANYIGVIIDGIQSKFRLGEQKEEQNILLASQLEEKKHEAFIFKRTDLCNEIVFFGLDLGERGKILVPKKEPRRLIEFIGDSITMGECVESKKASRDEIDEQEAAITTNPYYSYGAIIGRMLHTRVNLVAQSGIAMQDGLGLFGKDKKVGMQTLYSLASYNQKEQSGREWNAEQEIPNAIVISLGQFDQYPENFMAEDMRGEQAQKWKEEFTKLLASIRNKYPKTLIILTTSICRHSPKWDRAIGQVCANSKDAHIMHFLYNENARISNGFVTIAQSEQMAIELSGVLKSVENQAWN